MNQPLNPSAGADQGIASPIELSTFLQSMARQKGSDLFITVGAPVMMKVSGKLNKLTDITLKPDQARNLVLSVMTPASGNIGAP